MIMTTATTDGPLAKRPDYEYQPLMKVGGAAGLKGLENLMKARIAAVLPRHVTPERILKALMVAASKNPAIFDCTQESICKALMDASSLGLDCSGTLGSGYLIPFNKNSKDAEGKWHKRRECQFIPGYRGLIDLARRGGQIATIEAHVVYAQDKFLVQYGTDSKLNHTPYLGADRKHDVICFYAVATLRDGTKQIDVMPLADVLRIRNEVWRKNYIKPDKPSGPWHDHFGEMGRKTVVRRICKYLPLSPELEKAFELEDDAYGKNLDTIDVTEIGTATRTESLADRLSGADEEPVAGEVIDPKTGEALPPAAPDPKTKAEAARQVKALKEADAAKDAEPEEAPADFGSDESFDTPPPPAAK